MCMKFYWSGHRGHGRWTMSLICPCPRQITRTLSDDNHMLGHMADADVGQCPNMSTSAIYGADIENVQHWPSNNDKIQPTNNSSDETISPSNGGKIQPTKNSSD